MAAKARLIGTFAMVTGTLAAIFLSKDTDDSATIVDAMKAFAAADPQVKPPIPYVPKPKTAAQRARESRRKDPLQFRRH